MAYIELEVKDIENGIIYVSRKELCERCGISIMTLGRHVEKDYLNGFRFRGKVVFHPDVAEAYELLAKAGLLGYDV